MKKILIFVNDYDYFISHKYDALKKLDQKKFIFEIFSPNKKEFSQYNFKFKTYFIKPLSKNIFFEFYTFLNMFWIMFRKQNCIFQYYTIKPIVYGAIISKIFRIRKNFFIFSGLGNFVGNDKKILGIIINKVLKFFLPSTDHFFLFQNKNDFNKLKKKKIINSNKIYFSLGSGLNFKKLPKLKKNYKKKNNNINIVMPCRMKFHKGILDFIDIANYFKNFNYKMNFYLIGKTSKSNEYVQYNFLKNLKKNNNLKWLGEIKSKKKIYELADIILVLSKYGEGIPRVILESVYYNKYIISYDIPGSRDIIKNKICGNLVKLNDKKSVCLKLEMLYRNRLLLNKNLKQSKKFALRNFSLDKIKKTNIEVYKKIEV